MSSSSVAGPNPLTPVAQLMLTNAQALVDTPDALRIKETTGEQNNIIELWVAPGEAGMLIGKGGYIAHSLRAIANAFGQKLPDKKHYKIEIIGS